MEVVVRNVHVEVVVQEVVNIHVVMDSIVRHEQVLVVHVLISQQTHITMEIHVETVVDGHVIVDIIRMEANVQYVEIDNIVVQMVVVIMRVHDIIQLQVNVVRQRVQINQRIHIIQVMER